MSIKYQVIARGQPGVPGGGEAKFYATAKMTGEVDMDKLTTSIEKISTVNGADVRAVLYALVEVAAGELANSNIVRLGDLGSLRMSIRSTGCATADQVKAGTIKGSKVVFTPGKKLKKMQQALTYQKTK